MESQNEKNGCGENKGGCGGCGGCGHHHHKHMMKWLVKIALAILVFSLGYQLGEMKGMIRSQFGGYHGRGGWAMPMMYGGYDSGSWTIQSQESGDQGPAQAPAAK